MEKIIVDAMGDTCPIPVVKTKNAIKNMEGSGIVETYVDNEIAVQNLTKMAKIKGYPVQSEKLSDKKYKVSITLEAEGEAPVSEVKEQPEVCIPDLRKKNKVIAIGSNQMGAGSEELGKTLLKAFIYAVTQQDELPKTMLFYNSGIDMTCEGTPVLEDLKSLEAQGVEILSCGTCIDYYGKAGKVMVGSVTNMYAIVEIMEQADLLIKP